MNEMEDNEDIEETEAVETVETAETAEAAQDLAGFEVPDGHRSGFVAIVGRPSVGKSTLLNALLRQKIAIVSPRPQTTRTRQLGIITEETYQIILMDTPGIIQQPRHKMDEMMVTAALDTLDDVDAIVWLVDAAEPPGAADRYLAELLAPYAAAKTVFLALNKIDLVPAPARDGAAATYASLLPAAELAPLSALRDDGVTSLLERIVAALPEGPRYYPVDQITDVFVRDIAAELVREQLMLQLEDEIPYGTAVRVNEFKERPDGSVYINAVIFVERENHKGVVIGAKGARLREIGAAARAEIEKLVEGKVFLELWVKVEPNWRRDERLLRQFGYDPRAQ